MKTTTTKKMTMGSAVFAFMVAMAAGTAGAANTAHVNTWKTTGACQGCDLTNITLPIPDKRDPVKGLQGSLLTGSTLAAGMDLSGYNMTGVKGGDLKLQGANLSNANVTNGFFQRADFGPANLTGITISNTAQVNFTDSKLGSTTKPANWPASANHSRAVWTTAHTCDDPSMGGCKKVQNCPSPKSGYLKNDNSGKCKEDP